MNAQELLDLYKSGKRDFSRAILDGLDLSGANLSEANLSEANLTRTCLTWANLRGAILTGANLSDANLRGANLRGANLIRCRGLYHTFAPGLSSRGDTLYGHLDIKGGEIILMLEAGCKTLSPGNLRAEVAKTHNDNAHARQYNLAIDFIEGCFRTDMEESRWDYLLEWDK